MPQNYARAYKWWILAKAAGDKDAPKYLDILIPHMTQDQVAEGQLKLTGMVRVRERRCRSI